MKYSFSDLLSFVQAGANILSANSGMLEVKPENRGLLCLVEVPEQSGHCVLAVSSSHRLDPFVLAYQDTLKRHGFVCQVLPVTMQEVLEVYRAAKGHFSKDLDGNESNVQRYIIRLIRDAANDGASDLHIVAGLTYCEIRCRIDGYLRPVVQLRPEEGLRICATIYQSMCDVAEPTFRPMQAQRSRMRDEFLAECRLSGARVNTRPLDRGMLMVLRLLYSSSSREKHSLEDLGYLPEQCQTIVNLMDHRNGIVLLSGPTGSGKSTTLKFVMQQLLEDNSGIHLLTLEDPPEYPIDGANQSPVSGDRSSGDDVTREWAMAIADAMRLDPDVLMIGEVRDSTTAKMAFRAAMTGHLVWTTIHANDALAILSRLQEESVMESLLFDATLVVGLINQSLVQVLCSDCKIPLAGNEQMLSDRLLGRLEQYCQIGSIYLQGEGCSNCKRRGVIGRTVVAEVIETSHGLMKAFINGHHAAAAEHWLGEMNGLSKMDALIRKVNMGIIDPRAGERIVGPIKKYINSNKY